MESLVNLKPEHSCTYLTHFILASVLCSQAHESYANCLALYGGVNNTHLPSGMTFDEKCHNLEHWLSEVTTTGHFTHIVHQRKGVLHLPAQNEIYLLERQTDRTTDGQTGRQTVRPETDILEQNTQQHELLYVPTY